MLKPLIRFICCCFILYSHGQSSSSDSSASMSLQITNEKIPDKLLMSNIKIVDTYKDIQGTPYIQNTAGGRNIPLGKIYDSNMNYLGAAFVMYNGYTDEMEISAIEDSINFFRLKKESNSYYIKLYNKLYRAYVSGYEMNYFVVLSKTDSHKMTLLKREKVVFIKKQDENVSLVKNEPSSFRRIKDVFFLKIDKLVYKVPKGKRSFFALFKEHADQIKAYVKRKRLKINEELDLIDIISFSNSLEQ